MLTSEASSRCSPSGFLLHREQQGWGEVAVVCVCVVVVCVGGHFAGQQPGIAAAWPRRIWPTKSHPRKRAPLKPPWSHKIGSVMW